MSDQSSKSHQSGSKVTETATSSTEFQDGLLPFDLPDGPLIDPSGPQASRVSRSRRRASGNVKPTKDTSGPCSFGSSASADLQYVLASRLRATTDIDGSPEYVTTWRTRVMQSGVPICRLAASSRRTADSDSSGLLAGWPTPAANEFEPNDMERMEERRQKCKEQTGNGNGFGLTLGMASHLVQSSEQSSKSADSGQGAKEQEKEITPNHAQVENGETGTRFAGWPTPMAGNPGTEDYNPAGNTDSSRKTVELLSGWATPTASEKVRSEEFQDGRELNAKEALFGWGTPTARDGKDSGQALENDPTIVSVDGRPSTPDHATHPPLLGTVQRRPLPRRKVAANPEAC